VVEQWSSLPTRTKCSWAIEEASTPGGGQQPCAAGVDGRAACVLALVEGVRQLRLAALQLVPATASYFLFLGASGAHAWWVRTSAHGCTPMLATLTGAAGPYTREACAPQSTDEARRTNRRQPAGCRESSICGERARWLARSCRGICLAYAAVEHAIRDVIRAA